MAAKRLLFCSFVVLSAGCVPSLHELYTEDTIVFEEKLLGKCVQEQDIWQFEEGDKGKSYSLTIIQKEEKEKKTSKLIGHLVKIDGDLFLDMYPDEMEMGVGDWYKFHLLGVHTFMKVDRIEPEPRPREQD